MSVLYKDRIRNAELDHAVWRDINIRLRLQHPNILRLYGFDNDQTSIYLFWELAVEGACTCSALYKELQNQSNKRFDEKRKAGYILSLADA